MSKLFEPHYQVVLESGFGTSHFKGYLRLHFAEDVWHDLEPASNYIKGIFNGLMVVLADKLKHLWKTMIINNPTNDTQTIERYGDIMGSDLNLSFRVQACLWEEMLEEDRQEIISQFERHHELIYKKYKEFYRGNDKYGN